MRRGWTGLLLVLFLASGCGKGETPEQKLEAFQKAHYAIYDAWAATSTAELEERLSKGLTGPLLKEQLDQQQRVMQARLMQNERHGVRRITYNKLELIEDGKKEFTVYADWTVEGYIEHGDVHEQKVSYHKQFHAIKEDGVWKLDGMSDLSQ
jgi:hypothetical protein